MTNIEIAKLEGWMTRLCDTLDAINDAAQDIGISLRTLATSLAEEQHALEQDVCDELSGLSEQVHTLVQLLKP